MWEIRAFAEEIREKTRAFKKLQTGAQSLDQTSGLSDVITDKSHQIGLVLSDG